MGKLLDRLLDGGAIYSVRKEADGYTLVALPGHLNEFSDVVREAADHAGDEFIVFTTSNGDHGYSRMFVMAMADGTTG